MESDFARELFTQEFYRRLSNTFGHIAHYDRTGFYETFFATPEGKMRFVRQALDHPCYGDPALTYSDVERALQGWLQDNGILAKVYEQGLQPSTPPWAERFAAILQYYPEDDFYNAIDLLTDCLRWCEHEGVNVEGLLLVARSRFEAERDRKLASEGKGQPAFCPEQSGVAEKALPGNESGSGLAAGNKSYTVKVGEIIKLWGVVTVEAKSQQEAENVAAKEFVPEWCDSHIDGRTATILTENGQAMRWSEEASDMDRLNPYRPRENAPESVQQPDAKQVETPVRQHER